MPTKPTPAASAPPPRRRRFTRIGCRVTVALTEAEGQGHLLFTSSNLSLGGIFLESELLLEVGSVVKLAFKLPGNEKPVVAEGAIVRVTEDGTGSSAGMGLEFTRMNAGHRQQLEAYLQSLLPKGEEASRGRR